MPGLTITMCADDTHRPREERLAIDEIINRLRQRTDLGRRPESFWQFDAARFVVHVLELPRVREVLDRNSLTDGTDGRSVLCEMPSADQERLASIVYRVDRYHRILADETLVRRKFTPAVGAWLRHNVSWLRANPADIVALAFQERSAYDYGEDPLVWLVPTLTRIAVDRSAHRLAPLGGLPGIRASLLEEAAACNGALATFGVSLDATRMVDAALLHALQTGHREQITFVMRQEYILQAVAEWDTVDRAWPDAFEIEQRRHEIALEAFDDRREPSETRAAKPQREDAPEKDGVLEDVVLQLGCDDDPLRKRLARFVSRKRVWLAIYSRYATVAKAVQQAQLLVYQVAGLFPSGCEGGDANAESLLIGLLLADHVAIPSTELARKGRAGRGLNDRQKVCLWLADGTPHGLGVTGYWFRRDALPAGRRPPIPPVIERIFAATATWDDDGGEQRYLDASFIMLVAHTVASNCRRPLHIGDLAGAHQCLADTLAKVSFEPRSLSAQEASLVALLAEALGVHSLSSPEATVRAIRHKATEAGRAHEMVEGDMGRMLTWIVGTCLEGQTPEAVLLLVQDSTLRNGVRVDLHKGRTTLRDAIAARLWAAVVTSRAER